MPEFVWAEGSRISGGLSAQSAGDELTSIAGVDEVLTPDLVVSCARNESSPLHGSFGDSVRITRAFVHIESSDDSDEKSKRFYVTIRKAVKDEGMSDYVLQRALAELNAWRRKYRNLEEVIPIIKALDGLI